METESLDMHGTKGKASTSENHGVKSKASNEEPLLENRPPPILKSTERHESKDSIPMPDQDDGVFPRIPDINDYQNKKTAGAGLMDIALLFNNVNQLKHIITNYEKNPFFYISLTLVIISIILQIILGIFLIINSRYDVKNCDDICKANRINNWITVVIFLITVVNVFTTAFEMGDM